MNEKTTVENILAYALKNGADHCEIFWSKGDTATTQMRDGEISDDNGASRCGYSVRLIKDGVPGFSFGTLIEPELLKRSVDDALLSCAFGEQDADYHFTAPGQSYPVVRNKRPENLSFQQKREFLELLAEGAAESGKVKRVERVGIGEHRNVTFLMNSLGLDLYRESYFVSGSAMVVAADAESEHTGGYFKVANSYFDLNYRKIGREAAVDGLDKLGAVAIDTAELPVVLRPEAVLELLSLLTPSFLGNHVEKGMSVLKDKLGQTIAGPGISLYDDALMSQGVLQVPFDDEGQPCRRNCLIGKGEARMFLYNNKYGARAGRASTGNGFNGSHKSLPSVGIASYYLENGDTPLPDLLGSMEHGLWLKELMGLHMADTVSGNFSLGGVGKLIEGGEVSHGVRGVMVAGNIFDLLKDVETVGDDFTVFGDVGAPSLKIKSLKISGK